MSGKILIVGGGISGLSAATIINLNNNSTISYDVDIISKDIGGDYLKGGLKYIHADENVMLLLNSLGILRFGLKKVNGAIYNNDKFYSYPELFLRNVRDGLNIQKQYWNKTRGTKDFDSMCMNDPWGIEEKQEIMIDFGKDGLKNFVHDLINISMSKFNINLNEDILNFNFDTLLNRYDYIIWTAPISLLYDWIGIKYHKSLFEMKRLSIAKFKVDEYTYNKCWWDFLYVPDNNFKFHRITKIDDNMFDVEYNEQYDTDEKSFGSDFVKFIRSKIDLKASVTLLSVPKIPIKGHLATSFEIDDKIKKILNIDDQIILLGRYAEWNKRIKFNNVVEKIYKEILPKLF